VILRLLAILVDKLVVAAEMLPVLVVATEVLSVLVAAAVEEVAVGSLGVGVAVGTRNLVRTHTSQDILLGNKRRVTAVITTLRPRYDRTHLGTGFRIGIGFHFGIGIPVAAER
jgi:hypothetical protein